MKCPNNHDTQNFLQKHFSGINHFLNEKSVFTTVHPIWVIFIAALSCIFTNSHIERLLITTFAFYSVLLEMLNSSIEITNDRFGCQYNQNTKIAKELSGTVTALSRFPFFILFFYILYKNLNKCNQFTRCNQ